MPSKKPKPRNTMDVDPSWLESEPEPAPPPPRVPKDLAETTRPPKGAAAGPRRRETMEVQMDWLEPAEPEAEGEREGDEPKDRATTRPKKRAIPPLLVSKPHGKLPPPLPRSEPPAPARRTTRPPGRKGR